MVSWIRRIGLARIIALLAFSLCSMHSMHAQTTATITGVVTDVQGAAVQGATVVITNTATGISRTVTSDAGGRYSVGQLIPGTYRIVSDATGFKKTEIQGVTLQIAATLTENITAQVGGATETVDVTADTVETQTETSENGEVIDNRKVVELPLANRQFYNLAEIAPGVMPPAQASSLGFRGGFNVNGAPETDNQFIVNGTFNNDMGTNQPSFRPSVETIAEFKVLSGIYSADYGRFAGGQIVMVTKQGGNRFHGSIYEFIRNGAIEAKPWSYTPQSVNPAFKQNTFGATVGGPIIRDKAFFFFGYEGQRIRQQIVATSSVPSTWSQAGCLPASPQVYNPSTGAALALTTTGACATAPSAGYDISKLVDASGNSLWNSTSGQLGRLMTSLAYPAPNVPVVSNSLTPSNDYLFSETRSENSDAYNVRGDYKYSDNDSFSGTWNYFHDPSFEPSNSLCSTRTLPNFGCFTNQLSTLANIGEIHIFKPTLLNDVRFGFSRLVQPRIQQDNTTIGTLWPGLPGQFTGTVANNLGLPSISLSGSTGYTATGGQTNLPQDRWTNHFQFTDSVTWNHGPHTFKFGFDMTDVKATEFEVTTGRGSLTFNPSTLTSTNGTTHQGTTGNALGDALLGLPSSTSDTPTAPLTYNRFTSFDFYALDDWKVLPNLTLNLGLRYELDAPVSEKYGQISSFQPTLSDPYAAGNGFYNPNGGFVVAANVGAKAFSQYDRNNFAPRVGFAYQPFHNEKTVVKGGAGVFYQEPILYNEFLSYSLQFPVRYPKTFTPGSVATGGSINLANPFPAELPLPGTPYCIAGTANCNAPVIGQTCGSPCSLIPVVTGTTIAPNYATPYYDEWSLSVQRQLSRTTLVEVGYYGSKGSRIAGNAVSNYNRLGPTAGTVSTNAATGVTTTGLLSSATLQSERVYPQWGSISYHKTGFNSEYESLQARLEERTKSGASILVSYTFGKSEDDTTSAQDPRDYPGHNGQSGDKGLSTFNPKHRLVISPVYPLPFGKGQMFLNNGGIAGAIAGGFQVSGIYQYSTGRPFNISDSTSYSGVSGGGDRPDLVIGQNLNGYDSLQKANIHTPTEWFNIHAVAFNPPGTFGNIAPNAIIGPGFNELDLTIARTFAVKEWAKIQFRLETFNLANHPNFQNPTASFSGTATTSSAYPASNGYPSQSGYCTTNGSVTSTQVVQGAVTTNCTAPASFGSITAANAQREIQASLRITY